ncbi:MAG: sigma-70 family RNA polymerase sigma factor [Phycisphaerales bacterium]|nr:MAG: sigma-70 family RNA polymerase sigma factor [Phycisphaerales bacterium]
MTCRYIEDRFPRKLRSVADTDDLLQHVWLAAFRTDAEDRPANDDAFQRWLLHVARNEMINVVRGLRTHKRGGTKVFTWDARSSVSRLFSRVLAPERSPSSIEAGVEATRAVKEALGALPATQREAITLCFLQGKSHTEAAAEMNRTRGAVSALLSRGLAGLRKNLGWAGRFLSERPSSQTVLQPRDLRRADRGRHTD